MPADSEKIAPTSKEWFAVWLRIGLQSFGGGVSTIALMRQELVDRRGWITADEFAKDFALSQLAPGINIIGMAILFGKRVRGSSGVALAMAGLLLPSATATACITAVYAQIKGTHAVTSALRLVMPAVAGLGIATAFQTAQAPVKASRTEGSFSVVMALLLIAIPALAVLHWQLPTVYCFVGASLVGALWVYLQHRIWRSTA